MKDNRLISMTDFVIQQRSELMFKELGKACCKYADFLKQPLRLEMFVPCDDKGNILKEPKNMADAILDGDSGKDWANKSVKYEEAKEKLLFENVEVYTNWKYSLYYLQKIEFAKYNAKTNEFIVNNLFDTVESIIALKPILTKNAIKQIQP